MFYLSLRNRLLAVAVTVIFTLTPFGPALAREAIGSANDLEVRATATPGGVLIEWAGAFTSDILGFNIYRTAGGGTHKINESLIAGPTLVFGTRSPSYFWFDRTGTSGSEYEVEAINVRGQTASRITAVHAYANAVPQYQQARLLSDSGARQTSQTAYADWDEEKESTFQAEAAGSDSFSADDAVQWELANQRALRIGVRADGWYRITQAQMTAAGFDVTANARNLQLFAEGIEQAISVSRDDGALSSADFVEFWGRGLDTPTSETRVYWLVNGTQSGKRITRVGEIQTSQAPFESKTFTGLLPRLAQTSSSWFFPGRSPGTDVDRDTKSPERFVSVEPPSKTIPSVVEMTSAAPPPAVMQAPATQASQVIKPVAPDVVAVNVPTAATLTAAAPSQSVSVEKKVGAFRSPARLRAKRRTKRAHQSRKRHHAAPAAIADAPPAFSYVAEYKNRSIYYTAALNGDHENFFGPVIFGNGVTVTLNLNNIEKTSGSPAQLQLSIQGATLGQHQLTVTVNGATAGTVSWIDTSSTTQTLSVPIEWLVEGDNLIRFIPASPNDTSLLDYARVTYSHSFRADNDYLQFSVKSTQTARIDGFSTGNIRVLDITDPNSVQEVRPIIEASGNSFGATVPGGDRGKARRLVAQPADRISQPASLTLNQPSTLNSKSNGADFIIISYRDFIPSLTPLIIQRQAQGYVVKVVDVEDVFDEFSFGERTPQALRDFLSLAKTTWTRAPAYLMLFGDASFDPRNYGGAGNFDFVPTKLVDTGVVGTATALETASDDWFTDFDGNGIGDISIGRLPVRSVVEANLAVSKIVNFSPANTGNRALLVADSQDSYYFNFEAADDQVAGVLPGGMTIQKVYRRLQSSDAETKMNIVSNLNSGTSVTVYSGHGNVTLWRGSVFTASDAMGLTNGNRLSFVVVMDCLNGYFADPTLRSLAESFIAAPNGGAVASFASSGLTIPDGQHEMGLQMFQLLYSGSSVAIGDASRQAKSATTDMDVRRTWILFGDPTLKIR